MEKIKLNELGLLPDAAVTTVQIGNCQIEVKRFLPYETILKMIEDVAAVVIDDRPFVSAPLQEIVTKLVIVEYYTNLDIDVFNKPVIIPNEVYETYDLLAAFNAFSIIENEIDVQQLQFFIDTTDKTLKSIVDYRNSAKGILDNITENAKDNSQALQESFDILQNDEALKEAKKFVEVYQANN